MNIEHEQYMPEGSEPVIPSQEQEGNAGDQAQNVTQSTDFVPDQYMMTYKGRQIAPKDKQHLINLAQQGYGYSQEMEKLNKERREFEERENTLSRYSQLDEAFQNHPQLAEQVWGIVNNYKSNLQQDTEIHPEVQSKLSELEQFKQTMIDQQADNALEAEMSKLKELYKDQDWAFDDGSGSLETRILRHAYDTNAPSLTMAYKDYMWDAQNASTKANTLKQIKEQRQKNFQAGKVDSGIPEGTPASQSSYNSADSYGDLVEKALNDVGG